MPELLDGTNHIAWFKAGEQIFTKNGIQYLGIPGFINARSIIATLIVQVRPSAPYRFGCIVLTPALRSARSAVWSCCGCLSGTSKFSEPRE